MARRFDRAMVGLNQLAGLGILAVIAIFLVVIHLGLATTTALTSTRSRSSSPFCRKCRRPDQRHRYDGFFATNWHWLGYL
jgi:hypothetical protein